MGGQTSELRSKPHSNRNTMDQNLCCGPISPASLVMTDIERLWTQGRTA